MEIAFRTGESHDRVHVRRDDRSEFAWRWRAGGPPHDLVHWVVEDALPLERGFWGLVGGGADPSADLEGDQILQAEAVVNSIQQGLAMRALVTEWVERYRSLGPREALHVTYPSASRRSEAARSGG